MPWTELGCPVTIDILFGFVKLGIALWTSKLCPLEINASILGERFSYDASSRYSFWLPSRQITIAVLENVLGYSLLLITKFSDTMINI